ncbi:MAG TPA: CHAT domain-containing tetratricopeptide repeat protein [Blastocatellia bacterium]|nr:CHAT domain-containing tetratricopeptide repeat protein [Blastocatellia bacterium]
MIKQLSLFSHAWRSRTIRSHIATVFSLYSLCWMLASATPPAAAGQAEAARELLPGAPIERELQGGETHVYKITLAGGDYLRLFISPVNTNVESQLFVTGASTGIEAYMVPTGGPQRFISLIAEVSGDYRLEIRAKGNGAKPGRYQVKIEDLRPASEQDRIRVAAERAEGQGRALINNAHSDPAETRRQGIAKYEEALVFWRKYSDRKGEMRMMGHLGHQYSYIGEIQIALEYTKQAIEIARTVGDRYQEANLLLGFGEIYRILGEYQKALDSMNQARQLFKSMSKRFGESIAVSNIGYTLVDLGEREKALPYFEEALSTVSSFGDRYAEANILLSMGRIHRSLGDKRKGIEFHNRALAVTRESKLIDVEVLALGNLGTAYLESDDKQKALDFFEQALKLCRTSGVPRFEGEVLTRIGEVAYLSGDNQKALDFLNQALALFRSIRERGREAKALHGLAQVNYSLGNLDEAKKELEQALEIQESLRANVINQQLRDTIFSSAQNSFALYIDLLMQLHKKDPAAGHEATALEANERARARSLLELLSESQADIRQGVPGNLLEQERSLQQQINAKAAARTRLLGDKRTEAQGASFEKEIAELTARYREVRVQIRQSSPRYAALTQPQPLTAAGIQQLLDDNTVLLEFALGEKQSWLWAVTRASINSYTLPSGSQIEIAARKVYELLTARQPKKGEADAQYQARINEADAKFQSESTALSQMLLGQIAAKLQREWKGKRLAIVAPGALEYIPFAALPMPSSLQPLITECEIVNLPSASALAALRSETAGRKSAEKSVAVLADPVFDPSDPRVLNARNKTSNKTLTVSIRSAGETQIPVESQAPSALNSDLKRALRGFNLVNERGGFSRLPFSREEARAIASFSPKDSLMQATDFQANRANAIGGELARYRIIHFATHGLLNSEYPELSGLVLSLVTEDGKPQDGFLRMHEIYNLNLPADLIVLSACQTALGKQIKGEGLVGLTRGFMYAGGRRVVASLWQVDDLATAQLMKSFYRGVLKEGLRPAAALRVAQLETIKQKRWSSPFFWAAFTIQGEWK